VNCRFEEELIDAIGRGYVNEELTAHVAGCESCRELQIVAGAVLDDRRDAMIEAAVPNSGTMWWRMQVRLRQEAQAAARRSLLIGQAATIVIAVALTASLFGVEITAGVKEMIATIRLSTPLLIALTASLLIAPIAGWVAIRQK
jgi:hypothetical protein